MPKRRKKGLRGWRVPTRGTCEITPTATMADVKACARQCATNGRTDWFEKGAMRYFRTRIGSAAYADGKGGAYFVTTEQSSHDRPRKASVRRYDSKTCSFDTIGEFMRFDTTAQATAEAKRLAKRR